MASIKIKNIKVSGISAAVPKEIVENENSTVFPAEDVKKFVNTTAVARFRVGPECTSDLCYAAAEKLIADLGWDKSEIEMLVFISQTPDYILPNTAPILQDRLRLPKSCIAFDMTLGCSGYIFGLSTVASYMAGGTIKKALFLCGDTPSKTVNKKDKTTAMLFGDAGTATALEYVKGEEGLSFCLGSDGSGYKAIIIPDGGYRNPINSNSLTENTLEEGVVRNNCNLFLDGMDVFSFGITQAPASVKETLAAFNETPDHINYFVFHQANMMMNEMIRKKLKLTKEQVPYSLENYGNTSSASIPVTMITEIREQLTTGKNRMLLCGFGVGLSWGSCILSTENLVIPELIEI